MKTNICIDFIGSSSSTSDETDGQSENNLSVDLKKRIKGENVKYSAKLESGNFVKKLISCDLFNLIIIIQNSYFCYA